MKTNPVEILFGTYRRKILALLLLRPDERFHVREIARLIEVPAGSLHRELKLLAQGDLLTSERSGNQVYYQANRNSPIFAELAGILRKTVGMAYVLRDALDPLSKKIEFAFIFGSVAQGKEQAGSDVDLFVVGEVEFTEVIGALSGTHQVLGREVNPVLMSRTEFVEKSTSDPFLPRLIEGEKIFVWGEQSDFEELVADRHAEGAHGDG
ncbi:MAG: DNA polymerase subunit beta [Desulfuromonas sp.]|nr:MAG: DNA polymerase subunit beta [Desulfuromonas sp.]